MHIFKKNLHNLENNLIIFIKFCLGNTNVCGYLPEYFLGLAENCRPRMDGNYLFFIETHDMLSASVCLPHKSILSVAYLTYLY